MIFVTVGTQLPFDRLVSVVDQWAARQGRRDVFAQAGPTTRPPRFIAWAPFIDAGEFQRRCESAELIVAHLGMGSIITALELGKPILVMPRQASLHEHRNDHQAAMARRLAGSSRVSVAWDGSELEQKLSESLPLGRAAERLGSGDCPHSPAIAIRRFLLGAAGLPAIGNPPDESGRGFTEGNSVLAQAAEYPGLRQHA
jgi:UDP-N-acetylglucosamine transferase subunit ALG13